MRRITILLSLGFLIFLAGCVQPTPEDIYKNDVITIENYAVETFSPYSGSFTGISFDIQNNGDTTVKRVEVNFFDVPGFEVTSLKCQDEERFPSRTCVFNNFESLDTKKIEIKLKAPSNVNSPTSYTVSYSVKYEHTGVREALIPIIDGKTVTKPLSKFSQSKPTYGPIQLDIQPSLEKEIKVDNKVVKEYWGIIGRIFETKFRFSNVGTVQGQVKDVEIPIGYIRLNTMGTLDETPPCDFPQIKAVSVSYDTLICNFSPRATEQSQPQYTAIIQVIYDYTYEYIKTETFVVQPRLR